MKPHRGTDAFSFVEVLIATAILAMAFVPIAGLINDSFSKVSEQRMEAAVASYAAQVVNEWMFEKDYDDIACTSYPLPEKDIGDGIVVQVVVDVWEVDPGGSSSNDMTFEYYRIPYHFPCSGASETNSYPVPPSDIELLRNIDRSKPPFTYVIDSKYQNSGTGTVKPPLKTMHFTFQWRGKWEAWPTDPRKIRMRTRHIICRRANLE